jgi:Ni/Fe-hydrogenase subunit HybB-like protein
MENLQPIGGKIWTKPFKFLTVLVIIAGILILKRFIFGIGSVANLNDAYPWGLWIVYDVVTGTAIACGGYALAMVVYIFNRGQYHPLVRSALLASMFGYTMAGVSIVIDTGRYWQLPNIFIPPYANPNSVMFEVAVCVSLYVAVMWIEFSPAFLEQWKKPKLLKMVNRSMFFFIALGVLLPTLHQSSLGALMIAMGEKLSPLWQTQFIPLLFLLTAITMGYGIVIFESLFSAVNLKRPLETSILGKLSKLIPILTVIYLALRLGVILWNGHFALIFKFDLNSIMFLIEMITFLIPTIILFSKEKREKPRFLFIAAAVYLLAGSLYRFNAFIVAFDPGHGYSYFPALQEIMITVGIIAFEIMMVIVFIKKFPVHPAVKHA